MGIDINIEELKETLERISPADNGWRVTSYQSDFEWIWGLGDKEDTLSRWLVGDEPECNLVIIWDGMPDDESDGINILEHLTPYDWVLSFSYQQLRECAESLPKLRILILDLYSHHQATALSVKMLPAFCHAMPWMQVCRTAPMGNKYAFTLTDLVDRLKKPGNNTLSEMDSKSAINLLEPVVDAWVGNVSRGNDHHAIANLIAPRLLLNPAEKSEVKPKPTKEALSRLIENLGLLPHQNKQDNALLSVNNPWIDRTKRKWSQMFKRLGSGKRLKLLLLDDQWEDGWGEVICKAIGVEFKPPEDEHKNGFATIGSDQLIQVKACGSANWLFEKDKPLSDTSDQRFTFRLDDEGDDCQEILFLDLRLFSRKPITEEARFIEKLVEIAERLSEEDDPPWPNFTMDTEELTRIRSWTKEAESKGRDDAAYIESLTLLPRILSLIDLAYPIIVFSSTGKREVMEKLKSYENVITNLEKPRLNRQSIEDIGSETKYKFINAFTKSLDTLVTRNKCFELSKLTSAYSGKNDGELEKEKQNHIYIEFFIDEGPEIESVGGCYALFSGESMQAAQKKADAFDDEMVRQGVVFFESDVGVQPNPGLRVKTKKANCDRELQNALNSADRPDCLGAFRLFNRLSADNYSTENILHRKSIDNQYRLVLNALIELALFEITPALKEQSRASECNVSIYVATKLFEPDQIHNIYYRFGILPRRFSEKGKSKLMQTSISEDGVYPLLIDQFSTHQKSIGINRAYARSLRYTKPEYYICRKCHLVNYNKECSKCKSSSHMSPDYRALHYIADEVMSLVGNGTKFPSYKNSPYRRIFTESKKSVHYDGNLDNALNESLLASRSLDLGDVPTAIAKVRLPNSTLSSSEHFPSPHYWIARRTAKRLDDIDGREFMEIVDLLRHDVSLNHESPRVNYGHGKGPEKKTQKEALNSSENIVDIPSEQAFESASKQERKGKVKARLSKTGKSYVGLLIEGEDRGERVQVPISLFDYRPREKELILVISYKRMNKNPHFACKAVKIINH